MNKVIKALFGLMCLMMVAQAANAGMVYPQIAAGGYYTVALKSDGTVVAWGAGLTNTGIYPNNGQSIIPAGLSSVTAIAAGGAHAVALKADGTVVAWGYNVSGQTTIPAGLSGVTAIAAGAAHTVALKADGTVVAWGSNTTGQTTIPAGLSGVTAIAAGYTHTVALKADGTVVAWGYSAFGQTTIPVGLTGVIAIAAGHLHTVALKADGTVVAWGGNSVGQTTIPVGLTGVTAIAAGRNHTVALKLDGTVVAWGWNFHGQTTIPVGLTGVIEIAADVVHTVALKSDGTVVAWGDNLYGQTTIPVGLVLLPALDSDNDGVADTVDAFPNDIAASVDSDGDGYPDFWNAGQSAVNSTSVPALRLDALPNDPAASIDSDGDGYPDAWNVGKTAANSTSVPALRLDAFPNDPAASIDSDGDGYPDFWNVGLSATSSTTGLTRLDDFPNDPAASLDSDMDGFPDSWNVGKSAADSTSIPALALDLVPNDPMTGSVDVTAPVVVAPAPINFIYPDTTGQIQAFLNVASATDNVGVVGNVTHDAPAVFPLGSTTVTFTATDAAGNVGTATSTVLVQASVGLEAWNITASTPANVSIQFRAFDSSTLVPMGNLTHADFVVTEDGLPLSVESYYEVKHSELNTNIETILMFDISSSINTLDLQNMKQAAKAVFLDPYGNSLLLPNQKIAVYVFDDSVTMVQGFTTNPRVLESAVDGIVSRNVASTNMYGAIVEGMANLASGTSLDTVFAGQMILITDGRDTSGLHTLTGAQAAIGSNLLYVIGVQSPDLDTVAINNLTPLYTPITNFIDVEVALRGINQDIQDYANSFYQVLYTTPARGGTHTLTLSVAANLNVAANALINGSYDATGFSQPVASVVIDGVNTLDVGSTVTLQALTRYAALDPYAYTWSIDNPALATLVSKGTTATLTGSGVGVVQVTLTDVRFPSLSYTHQVVINNLFVLSAGVPQTAITLAVGDVLSLQSQLPSDFTSAAANYTWSIADGTVVSLNFTVGSNVDIHALTSGATTLTVTDTISGRSATIDIIVNAIGGTGGGTSAVASGGGGGGGCLAPSAGNKLPIISLLLLVLGIFGTRKRA